MRQSVAELDYAEEIVHVFGADRNVVAFALFHHLAGDFATDISDFPFQIAHTGFAGVGADQRRDRIVRELDVLLSKPRLQHLFLDQELLGNFDLLLLGITMQA